MSLEYNDILNQVEEKGNMGSIWQYVYFAPFEDFLTLAEKPDENGSRTFGEMNKLSVSSDTLKAGKKLNKIYTTLEKGGLQASRQGEYDAISHKVTLSLFNPGLDAASLDMLMTPNQNWIFFVKSGNKMFRLGNKQFPAKLEAEGEVGTGQATADPKGNTLTFASYEVGFAGEVVDQDAIEAQLTAADSALTATFSPDHGDTGVLVDATPTITFSKAVINADTLASFTNQQISEALTLKKVDVNGDYVEDVAFTAAIATDTVVTVTPNSNFDVTTIYELKFDATKILASDTQKRVTGDNYARFTTA